jgi:predicted Fe-Mo cluster-binding NifX family protein
MSRSAALMREAFKPVFEMSPNLEAKTELNQTNTMEDEKMIIAIPLAEGILATHFGHCGSFALVEANPETRSILGRRDVDAPPHEPGLLPNWLAERGVHLVIAGGMGQRAQELFGGKGIQVVVGAPAEAPEAVVQAYLDGNLVTTGNVCDH